ncbi:MAG: 50S ribosomal protein L18 [Candidatus Uhrbacteria bacterium]|nr:50S ribosomal protein L18 [Patescibacteria group bacterium]
MSKKILKKRSLAKRRQIRTRAKISGTAERPRLAVFRSLHHISAQIIDDQIGKTLASFSDQKLTDTDRKGKKPLEIAAVVGQKLAQTAQEAGIKKIVFDRRSYKYHGRVKALAEAVREVGIEF